MAFRYLIYRTDYGNTIVRETATDTSTGGTEASFYTDFVIPEIQPLYLWRVNTDAAPFVEPNTDQNINNWEEHIAPPPEPEDNATIGFVTGITSQKIDIVTGATGNVGIFLADGNLEDSGYDISSLTGSTTGGTPINVFNAYTGATEIRLTDIETDVSTISGDTTQLQADVVYLSGVTDAQQDDITYLSGETAQSQADIVYLSGETSQLQGDVIYLSGVTDAQQADIDYISGVTDTKLDITDFNVYSGETQPIIDAALTGVTNLGTGSTIGSTSGRDVTLKSISVIGGLSISGDINNIIISGETSPSITWGNITGTLSNQTDLQNALNVKLDITNFNAYTGTSETRFQGIEADIVYLSGVTDGQQADIVYLSGITDEQQADIVYISGVTDAKLNITDFNVYSGATDGRIDSLEADSLIFYQDRLVNITGATNGIYKSDGNNIKLGGALTEDTLISGNTYNLSFDIQNITLQAAGATSITDVNGNNIDVKTNAGIINLIGNDNLSSEEFKLAISENGGIITDSRAVKTGIEYALDYSSSFVNRSLVDKAYVDAIASGLDLKESVKVTTTSGNTDLDLTGGTFGGTIDGYTVADGDRVLIKNQDLTQSQNGVWVYSSGGNTFARAIDFVNPYVTSGAFMFIETGSTHAASGWVLVTQDPINVGTTDLVFTQFSDAGSYQAGIGIDISGNAISVDGASLAGNSISWTGNTFNVDTETGTLNIALGNKLNVSDFNIYSGVTNTRISGIESDVTYISGITDTKLNTSDFNTYSGVTDTRLSDIENDITYISGVTDTKLDTDIFTGYTASTEPNEIFLIHTGGTNINTIAVTAIGWDSVEVSGTSFLWSGGTDIWVKEAGDYELSYNIPFNANTNRNIAIGSNIIKNNSVVIDLTASAGGGTTNTGGAGSVSLSTVILTLALNDKLTLGTFRTEQSGTVLSSATGSVLIKKKNTLQ